ncbi:isopeptide-forming domain-containing fimbrial protein [Roseburia hominis]
MKTIKKMMALVLAMVMALAMVSMTAFAQDVDSKEGGTGSITIKNAAKGETYSAYRLFDATVGGGKVAYKGPVPEGLETYFVETSTGSGYVQATKDAFKTITYYGEEAKTNVVTGPTDYWTGEGMSDGLRSALTTWKGSQTPIVTAVSDGSVLKFTNLDLGYYVVTTSQGEQVISVDTTMPNVEITDKNVTTPTAKKEVNGEKVSSASIGETVTYTATFTTANYIGEEQVKSYTISDTLPEFLTEVVITEVKIVQSTTDKPHYPDVNLSDSYEEFTNKKITIPWVDDNGANLYKNGSTITMKYTAKITSTVNIDGNGNTNTVTITPNKDKNGGEPFKDSYSDKAVVKTYGAALKKTDGTKALAGAEFTVAGLSVEPIAGEAGVYRVVSYDKNSETPSTAMSTNSDGQLYIIGLKEGVTLKVTESKAPDGYNKLTGTTDLTPQKLGETIYETSGTRYYDADGNLVSESSAAAKTETVVKNYTDLAAEAVEIVNKAGVLLPSTGGIGTTIFYIVGAVLMIGAGVMLVTRKRMSE